jgi:hypothetical protein
VDSTNAGTCRRFDLVYRYTTTDILARQGVSSSSSSPRRPGRFPGGWVGLYAAIRNKHRTSARIASGPVPSNPRESDVPQLL